MEPVSRFKSFLMGFALALGLLACAATPIIFPYKFYHLSPTALWDAPGGKLVGERAQDDHGLVECRPVPGTDPNGKPIMVQRCAIVFYSELNALISDYKTTKQQLVDCQHGK